MDVTIKQGGDLTEAELEVINNGRKAAFGSEDKIVLTPGGLNWEAFFFFLRNGSEEIVAFAKLHLMKVLFQEMKYPVYCISTLVSLVRGKGYGCKVLREIDRFLSNQEKTAFLFCETELLPFYQKCGVEILPKEINQFYYLKKNGKQINDPNIVPGEVIVMRGKDGFMEKILANRDKKVGVID